jgi:hypothetical protein
MAWWVRHPDPTVGDALPVWLLYAAVLAGLAAVPWSRRVDGP